jgi:hypothetical protein
LKRANQLAALTQETTKRQDTQSFSITKIYKPNGLDGSASNEMNTSKGSALMVCRQNNESRTVPLNNNTVGVMITANFNQEDEVMMGDLNDSREKSKFYEPQIPSITSEFDSLNRARIIQKEDVESIEVHSKKTHNKNENIDDLLKELDDKSDSQSFRPLKIPIGKNLISIEMNPSPALGTNQSKITNRTINHNTHQGSIAELNEFCSNLRIKEEAGKDSHNLDSLDNLNWD